MSLSKGTLPGGYPIINSTTTLDELALAVSAMSKPQPPDPASSASANPAVARCCQAYARALKSATERGKDQYQYQGAADAEKAYCQAMPPLFSHENIRDFIACTAHGMLLDAIKGPDGAHLLYAAQIAHTILNPPSLPGRPGRPRSEAAPET